VGKAASNQKSEAEICGRLHELEIKERILKMHYLKERLKKN
jgi:hypothetical protein